MPNTHCLPTGSLGTNELPVPHVGSTLMTTSAPTPGSRRGVVVLLHGLTVKIQPSVPSMVDTTGFVPILWKTLQDALVADGWVVIQPQYAENMCAGLPTVGLFNDVNADAGHGSRYLTQMFHWWDHVVAYIYKTYGANIPIVAFGFSWGGWHSFQLAANKTSTLLAYVSHHAATLLSAVPSSITPPVDFSTTNTTGLDTTTTMLNGVSIPGAIGWGTSDPVVGFSAIQAIYNAASGAGKPVTSNAQSTGHTLQSVDITFYTDPSTGWFHTVVDPLAPAVH